jgi:uncharacterized protein (DUF934 family)
VPLLKDGKLADDAFAHLDADDPIPAEGAVLVDLTRWQSERRALLARGEPLGVRLASGESPDEIADDLDALALVALEFPAFKDGRAYSSARLLRERYGYSGEIRAVGDVGLEQLHFMQRVGFDAFEIDSDDPERDWQTAQGDMSIWYQPTGDERPTAIQRRKA